MQFRRAQNQERRRDRSSHVSAAPRMELNFQMLNDREVLVHGTYQAFTEEVKQILKVRFYFTQNCGARYNPVDKGWVIALDDYGKALEALRARRDENTMIKPLPQIVQKMAGAVGEVLRYFEDGKPNEIRYELVGTGRVNADLNEKLYQFQRECVERGIQLKGRILIADEMGVGKTVQSLAIAQVYQSDWPLLIICPSFLRLNWQDEIKQWLNIPKTEVQIICKQKQMIRLNVKVVIISYDLCSKMKEELEKMNFRIAIADECHYLKNAEAIRSSVCVPLLKRCKRVILLTGTPALAKPKDLFNQLSIIRPDIFNNFKDFGYRYCDPKPSRFTKGLDFDGACNLKELHYLLTQHIMIRRLKKDVLQQLPEKRRIKVRLPGDPQYTKQIKALLDQLGNIDIQDLMSDYIPFQNQRSEGQKEEMGALGILSKCYVLTGQAKIKAINSYLMDLIENGHKFIFFAHHLAVLDAVQEHFMSSKIGFMRIDGSVSQEQRHQNIKDFQNLSEIRIAILGLTSASVGITLTEAQHVVFGEMHWTPAIMLQAEDRAHRIGQTHNVDCHYLIGDETIDPFIYDKLDRKINTVSNFIDGCNTKFGAKQIKEVQFQPEPIIDVDIEEIIEIIESSKKRQQEQQQLLSQNIKIEQSVIEVEQQHNDQQEKSTYQSKNKSEFQNTEAIIKQLNEQIPLQHTNQKQTILSQFFNTNAKKQIQFIDPEPLNLKSVQKTTTDIPKRLGFEVFNNYDTKSTLTGEKRKLVNFQSNYKKADDKISSEMKQLLNK